VALVRPRSPPWACRPRVRATDRCLVAPAGRLSPVTSASRAKAPETGETRETPREASQATRESAERTHIDRVEVLVIGDLRMAKDYLQELKNCGTQHDQGDPRNS
jgi:hypothetical protein